MMQREHNQQQHNQPQAARERECYRRIGQQLLPELQRLLTQLQLTQHQQQPVQQHIEKTQNE